MCCIYFVIFCCDLNSDFLIFLLFLFVFVFVVFLEKYCFFIVDLIKFVFGRVLFKILNVVLRFVLGLVNSVCCLMIIIFFFLYISFCKIDLCYCGMIICIIKCKMI